MASLTLGRRASLAHTEGGGSQSLSLSFKFLHSMESSCFFFFPGQSASQHYTISSSRYCPTHLQQWKQTTSNVPLDVCAYRLSCSQPSQSGVAAFWSKFVPVVWQQHIASWFMSLWLLGTMQLHNWFPRVALGLAFTAHELSHNTRVLALEHMWLASPSATLSN